MAEVWQNYMELFRALACVIIDRKEPEFQSGYHFLSLVFEEQPQGDPYFTDWFINLVSHFSQGTVRLTSLPTSSPGILYSVEGPGWRKRLFIGPTGVEWQ